MKLSAVDPPPKEPKGSGRVTANGAAHVAEPGKKVRKKLELAAR